jgi:hypothetical protein
MVFLLLVVFGFSTKPLTMIRLFAELSGHYLKLEPSLHEILQVLSVTQFEKVPIPELFNRRTTLFDISNITEDIPNLF